MKINIQHKTSPLNEAVDANRNQRHATFVAPELIRDRLNPQAYRPEIMEALLVLTGGFKMNHLSELCSGPIRQGTTPEYGNGSAACLKIRDVEPMIPNRSPEARVSGDFERTNQGSMIQPGTVLITRSGEGCVGRAAVYLKQVPAFVSDDVFACPIVEERDSAFVAAYLNTWWGKRAIEIGVVGSTGQLKLSQSHVRQLPVPLIDQTHEKAIGNKVRKAERLRELAEAALTEAQMTLNEALEFTPMKSHGRSAWAPADDFEVSRFDAEYYQPHYLHMDHHLDTWRAAGKPISSLRSIMRSGSYGVLPSSNDYGQGDLRFLRAQDVGAFLIESNEEVLVPRHYANPKAMTREGDLLLEVKGEIAGGAICPKDFEGCLVNGSLYRMTLKEGVDAFYVLALLLSPIGVLQKKRAAANSVISYLSLDFLNDLLIPRLSHETESQIGQLLRSYTENVYESRAAIEDAKADVESLISNTLDLEALQAESAAIETWLAANPSPAANNSKRL